MTLSALELAQSLIRCPSVTPHEGGALDYLEGILKAAGFTTHRLTFSDTDTPDVQNLYARIGTEAPYLLFAGHTDVVPPGDEAAWQHGPFSGEIIDDRLYGRGAVDMKGGIAAFVAATLAHLKEKGLPRGSIGFLITGDEEGPAINGTPKLLEWAAAQGEQFDHCILGEPTNPQDLGDMIKIGRRGSLSAIITVEGQQGHVAYPHLAANPIPLLIDIVGRLTAEPLDKGNAFFDASNLEITSIDVGNAAMNVIPARAVAKLNIRFNDEHSIDSLKAWISGLVAAKTQPKITASVQFGRAPSASFITKPGAFVDLISSAITEVTGKVPVLSTSGGTSDARFIKDYCPVIEFGLVGQTMHKVDEHVAVPDLARLTDIYRRMIERYFGNG